MMRRDEQVRRVPAPPRFGAYSREPCGPGAYLPGDPGAYHEDFGCDESSLSDELTLPGTTSVQTPAQLRPSRDWVPQTPASYEHPPGYDGRPAATGGRGPINRQLFTSAPMPSRTQPCEVDFGDDYVVDGQDLAIGQRGKIPTPARSNRSAREIAIQTNRHSIDGHAMQASMEEIGRRPPGSGALDALDEDEDEGFSGPTKAVSELRYPKAKLPELGSAESHGPASWQGRAAMAQALSQAIAEEMAELERVWRLEDAKAKCCTEHVVAASLRKIAKKAEKSGVTQALLSSKRAAEEDAGVQARCERLEAEIAQADARLGSLGCLGDPRAESERPSCREALREVVASLSAEADMEGDYEVTGMVEQPVSFEMWLQRLAAVDAALRRQQAQLEDSRKELEDRERVVIASSFAHLPGGALDGISALMAVQ